MKTVLMINWNNKFAAGAFIHIDLAPSVDIDMDVLPIRVIIKEVDKDGNVNGVQFMADVYMYFPVDINFSLSMHNGLTNMSHGKDYKAFILDALAKDKDALNKKWCVYWYKKVMV